MNWVWPALLAYACACACSNASPHDGRWNVRVVEGDAQALAAALETGTREFRVARAGLAAHVEHRELPDDHGGRELWVQLRIDAPAGVQVEGGALEATVLLAREGSDTQVPIEDDLVLALERAAVVVQARLDLAREVSGGPRVTTKLLVASDPEIVLLALSVVHDHNLTDCTDRVVDLLTHPSDRVRLMAIETLGRIGGPEHAGALVRAVHLADPAQTYRTYEALAAVGGREAIGFLDFAADNEDDHERRVAAEQALQLARSAQPTKKSGTEIWEGRR